MRLGLHRHGGRADEAFRDYVASVRPPMVKALDPGDDANALAGWCRERGVETIGRNVFGPNDQRLGGSEQRNNIGRIVALARACPNILYWEFYNEAFDEPGLLSRYADASIEFMIAMEGIGRKAVFGCFSQGTPEVTGDRPDLEWREYLPAVQRAIQVGHVLGLHEYSGPFMDFEETWHCLRYRRSLSILRALGADVDRLKIAITESGIDDVWGRPGPQGKGYKPFQGSAWDQPPASKHGDFAGQLLWYGGELSRDPQIVGWVDFGWADMSGDWGDFDLSTDPVMLARVKMLQLQLPGGGSTPPPPPPPSEGTMLQGIDVSHHQGRMDWAKAKAAGAEYAWIKATEGTGWIDPQFNANAAGALVAGLLCGPYHFFRNSYDAREQAAHFHRTCAGRAWTLPPACDLEDRGPTDPAKVRAFVEAVSREFGMRPVIYTGAWWWAPQMGAAQGWATDYPVWLATYNDGVAPPAVPLPWHDWTIHQYAVKADGQAFGASSLKIDHNRTRLTRDQLAALAAGSATMNNAALIAWLEGRQRQVGVQINPDSALLRAAWADPDGLEVTLGEADFPHGPHGPAPCIRAQSRDGRKVAAFWWDAHLGRVVKVPFR